ncbi:MAG: hypothetical protein ABH842_02870 [Candidatus Micrarchaeota archaeon]
MTLNQTQKCRLRRIYDSAVQTAKKPFAMLKIRGLLDRNDIEEARKVQLAAGLSDRTMDGQISAALTRFQIDTISPRHPLQRFYFSTDLKQRLKALKGTLEIE